MRTIIILVILLCVSSLDALKLPTRDADDPGDHMDVRLWPPALLVQVEYEFAHYVGIGPKYFRLHRNGKRIPLPGKAKSLPSAPDPSEPTQAAPEVPPLIFYGPAE